MVVLEIVQSKRITIVKANQVFVYAIMDLERIIKVSVKELFYVVMDILRDHKNVMMGILIHVNQNT